MTNTVTKTYLVGLLKAISTLIFEQQQEDRAKGNFDNQFSPVADCCLSLSNDLEWMYGYTSDSETWTHIDVLEAVNPFPTFLKVDTVASANVSTFIYERAERYFSQTLIVNKELDWFYLDFIIAVCYRVLIKKYGDDDLAKAYPKLCAAIEKFDGNNVFPLIRYALWKLLKNGLLIVFLLFLFGVANDGSLVAGVFASMIALGKIVGWFWQMRTFGKLQEKSKGRLYKVQKLYDLFADGSVRWNLLDEDMKNLRALGIEFPLAIDTAVTRNKKL
jgi:hypothetical protein